MQNLLLHAHALGYDLCMNQSINQFQQSAIPAIYLETFIIGTTLFLEKGKISLSSCLRVCMLIRCPLSIRTTIMFLLLGHESVSQLVTINLSGPILVWYVKSMKE
jgi:hypothetical protein